MLHKCHDELPFEPLSCRQVSGAEQNTFILLVSVDIFQDTFISHAASGAQSLMFPDMRQLLEDLGCKIPVRPSVTIAFISPVGLKAVGAISQEVGATGLCKPAGNGVVCEM